MAEEWTPEMRRRFEEAEAYYKWLNEHRWTGTCYFFPYPNNGACANTFTPFYSMKL